MAYLNTKEIKSISEDILEFKDLALNISINLSEIDLSKSGYVIGLYGKWGQGKSSLLNCIKYFLVEKYFTVDNPKDAERLKKQSCQIEGFNKALLILSLVMTFYANPVYYYIPLYLIAIFLMFFFDFSLLVKITDHLISGFLNPNLLAKIKNPFNKQEPKELHYTIFEFDTWTFKDKAQIIEQFFIQLSGCLNCNDNKNLKQASNVLKFLGLMLGNSALKDFSSIVDTLGTDKNIQTQTEKLHELLAASSKKIIIIIDNLDRLNSSEICDVLKLVHFMSKLPNTLFLIAFDKQTVTKAIQKELNIDNGSEYLQKIIDISMFMPESNKQNIVSFCNKELKKLFLDKKLPIDSCYKVIFENNCLFYNYVKDLRDAKKYINTLRFLMNDKVVENLCIKDFTAIVFFELFIPEVIHWIKNNTENLVIDINLNYEDLTEKLTEIREKLYVQEHIFSIIDEFPIEEQNKRKKQNDTLLNTILECLFPILSGYITLGDNGSRGLILKQQFSLEDQINVLEKLNDFAGYSKRICNPNVFDEFFRYSLGITEYQEEFKPDDTNCQYGDCSKHGGFVPWASASLGEFGVKSSECISCGGKYIECIKCKRSIPIDDEPEIFGCYFCFLQKYKKIEEYDRKGSLERFEIQPIADEEALEED